MNNNHPPKDLSVGQVARALRLAPRTVSRYLDDGRMVGYRIPPTRRNGIKAKPNDGHRRVSPAEVIAFLERSNMPIPDQFRAMAETRVLLVGCLNGDAKLLTATLAGCEVRAVPGLYDAGRECATWTPNVIVLNHALGRSCCLPVVASIAAGDNPPRMVALIGDDADPADVVADGYAAAVRVGTATPGELAAAIMG